MYKQAEVDSNKDINIIRKSIHDRKIKFELKKLKLK